MSIFIKEMVKVRLKNLSTNDLLHYGKQYGFSISTAQAKAIIDFLKQNTLDPFIKQDREKMFSKLANITDNNTSKKAEKLFHGLIKSYGLEHLFQ
ncbi:DUF2624 family protein [Oceanobacillus sp. 143]|jgi:pantoate kinase|uniref:DUF2624 domain-containing protein n=1 Tax=Oceanobacillus zhaokaii TaxID=2052660 RepID=A0A345PHJ2_9BACI|nr:DUF2624 family protein [Oceanobacillus zhaokaii]AXI09472.1 DUF2624 domain-containing protein [Oceanobacillus zhaokaii]QGS68877.1 DUF2624 family protein [Oceanobacillus sp. 143]